MPSNKRKRKAADGTTVTASRNTSRLASTTRGNASEEEEPEASKIRDQPTAQGKGTGGIITAQTKSDEADDDALPKFSTRTTKANRRVAIRSFQLDEEEDEDDAYNGKNNNNNLKKNKKDSQKKKKKGLGFGGGTTRSPEPMVMQREMLHPGMEDNDVMDYGDGADAATAFRRYDREALSQLQAEQGQYVLPEVPVEARNDDSGVGGEDEEPDEIVMESPILTGDEALQFQQEDEGAGGGGGGIMGANVLPTMQQVHLHPDTEDFESGDIPNAWEEQVARRAGVTAAATPNQPTSYRTTGPLDPNTTGGAAATSSRYLSTDQLRSQVSATLTQLELQQNDLQRTLARRQVERDRTQQDQIDRHQHYVQQSGEAVEYYQILRHRFANWVGALRQLQSKVTPILHAMHELEAQVGVAHPLQREWENDMISVLYQHHRLEQVLGRQPDASIYDPLVNTVVDEFGRDVKSQFVMHREKRLNRRQRIREQRKARCIDAMAENGSAAVVPTGTTTATSALTTLTPCGWRGDESDAWLSEDEQESFRERHDALQQALQLALDELDEEYTRLHNLIIVFEDWKDKYPEDYRECYASLSLADLSSVLIQAEMCSLNDPWDQSTGHNEGMWISMVHSAKESGVLDEPGVERIFERAILPVISDLLDRDAYNVMSTRQTKCFCQFWKHMQRVAPRHNQVVMTKLSNRLVDYLWANLEKISLPIVTRTARSDQLVMDDELQEALDGATIGQMHRIKKIIVNILTLWAPVLLHSGQIYPGTDRLIQIVLDFCSGKFLFLLSSLQGFPQPRFAPSTADVFKAVWNALSTLGWLEQPQWMLQAAPLRAAAGVYVSM